MWKILLLGWMGISSFLSVNAAENIADLTILVQDGGSLLFSLEGGQSVFQSKPSGPLPNGKFDPSIGHRFHRSTLGSQRIVTNVGECGWNEVGAFARNNRIQVLGSAKCLNNPTTIVWDVSFYKTQLKSTTLHVTVFDHGTKREKYYYPETLASQLLIISPTQNASGILGPFRMVFGIPDFWSFYDLCFRGSAIIYLTFFVYLLISARGKINFSSEIWICFFAQLFSSLYFTAWGNILLPSMSAIFLSLSAGLLFCSYVIWKAQLKFQKIRLAIAAIVGICQGMVLSHGVLNICYGRRATLDGWGSFNLGSLALLMAVLVLIQLMRIGNRYLTGQHKA